MFPILYENIVVGEIPQHYGLGVLSDCVSCEVEQERNGIYELVMEYRASGIHASEIALRRILKVKPNFTDNPQLFRIDRIGKTMNGVFTCYAKHISYDMSGYSIISGTANNIASACNMLEEATCLDPINHPTQKFNIGTLRQTTGNFAITSPSSVKSWFVGKEGSILDIYGGSDIKYDNFSVEFKALTPATDRGVTIRYGKNLLELSQEMDCSNLYTHVLCFWQKEDVIKYGSKIATGLTLDVPNELILDISGEYEEEPTEAQITAYTQSYVDGHNLTIPENNITLNFAQIGELKDRVDLCDTVTIYYEALGISTKAKCIRTKWDCLNEKYIETEFGDVKQDLSDTMAANTAAITKTQKSINAVYYNAKDYTDAVKASLDDDIDNLQAQIDGNITTWYYNYAPTTSNLPASEWTTEAEKENHAGDLFFDNTTQFCYRWTYSNGAWTWVLIQDSTISQAIGMAQQALNEANAAISGVDVEYAQNQSTTTAPTSNWSTTAPQWQEGYYIWSRTKTTTSTGSTYSEPVCISGRDGVDGQDGQDGAKGEQGEKGDKGDKGDTGAQGIQGIQGEQGEKGDKGDTGAKGDKGDTGDTGIGVSNIVEQYYLSTSDSTQTGGSWSNTQPAWESGKYIWTRSVITWTDGTTTYTTPVLAQAINSANDLADHKRRVFITYPIPPYDEGDLWVFNGVIYSCNVSRASGYVNYRGETTTRIGEGSTTQTVTINGASYTAQANDVVFYEDEDEDEETSDYYIWIDGAWTDYATHIIGNDWRLATNYVNEETLENHIKSASEIITGNAGGYVILHDADGDGNPDEILIVNYPDITDVRCNQIWRWNRGGLGFSTSYASDDYPLALTNDGKINASYITTGELDASKIIVSHLAASMFEGGKISLGGYQNLDGVFELKNSANEIIAVMDKNGLKMYGEGIGNNRAYVLFDSNGMVGYDTSGTKIFWTNKQEFHMKKAVIEDELSCFGIGKFVRLTTYDQNNNVVNDGIALVGI